MSKKSNLQVNKKDPHKGFSMYIEGVAGLNTAVAANSIEDNECQALWNYIPVGKGLIRKAKGPLLYSTLAHNIQAFYNDVIGGALTMFVILADGSAGTVAADGTFTQATNAPAGTFNNTGAAIDIANWENTVLLITDATKGYFKFDGTTVTLISNSLNGNAIAIWQGRVMIAQGRILNYSGPLDYTFGTGSGTFNITSTNLRQQIEKIIPYMDSVYIVGDHAIVALTGTTISSDPTTWYQMEVFNSLGSIYPAALVNFQNNLYAPNEYGIFRIASTQQANIAVVLDGSQFTIQNFRGDVAQIYNLNFYLCPIYTFSPISNANMYVILAYCIELQSWVMFDFGFGINGVFTTRSIADHSLYCWSGNLIYKMFAGTGQVTGYIKSKVFNFGYPYIYKFIRFLNLDYKVYSGAPNFSPLVDTGSANNTVS